MDVVGQLSNEGPVKGKPFTAVPTIPNAPLPCGINPFRRSVLNATSLSWLRSREREESSSDARKNNADTVNRSDCNSDIRHQAFGHQTERGQIELNGAKPTRVNPLNREVRSLKSEVLCPDWCYNEWIRYRRLPSMIFFCVNRRCIN